jgi:hypothetical protein
VVHKIEYFDPRGQVVAVANLGDYEPVTEGFTVPTRIRIESVGPDKHRDSIRIELTSLSRGKELTAAQRRRLFTPPDPNRFENVYHYEDGRWVREP